MDDDLYDDDNDESEESGDERMEDEGVRPAKPVVDDDEFQFQVLSSDQVLAYMLECIRDTQSILGLTTTTIRLLLTHCKWDREKLLERFTLSDSERDKLFTEAHVVNPFRPTPSAKVGIGHVVSSAQRNTRSSSSRSAFTTTTGSRLMQVSIQPSNFSLATQSRRVNLAVNDSFLLLTL